MHRYLILSLAWAIACSDSTHSNVGTKDAAPDHEGGRAGASSGGSATTSGAGGASGKGDGTGGFGGRQETGDASSGGRGALDASVDSGDDSGNPSSGGTAGMAGTGGAAGSSGAGGAAGGGTGGIDTTVSVLQRNKHANRDGAFVDPKLTLAAVPGFRKETTFVTSFPGVMWASPLFLEKGPGGKGVFFAASTTNDVVALDETTGATVWGKNIGPAPTANGVPCGSIHPLGIISTPVIDAATGTIYVAGAIGTTSIARHEVHALSVMDGTERPGFPVVVSAKSGNTTFTPPPQNQRSALSLVNGILYVAYGGHNGDCGPYHGWVIGIDTKDPTKTGAWATLGQGEGIWAAGGLPSDGNGVFAVTGNSTVAAPDHMVSDSEQVVRITGLGVLDRTDKNLFFPAEWHQMDVDDADFGSNNPVYVSVPGSKPANVLVAPSKAGHLYLLDPANLGGMGKPLVDFVISSGTAVRTAPTAYTTPKGVHIALEMDQTTLCPGGLTGPVTMSLLLTPGSPPKPQIEWCAPASRGLTAPIATTTDGSANAIVWFMASNSLRGVDGDTGKLLYGAGGSNVCQGILYSSPIAVKGRVVVGSYGQLCAWSVH